MNKFLVTFFLSAILMCTFFSVSYAGYMSEDDLIKEQIAEKWISNKPLFEGKPFNENPSVKAPYKIGQLKSEFLTDGINYLNFIRFLAGLPDDLIIDNDLNNEAQHGAVLLAANQELTHYPSKPNDMPDDFFKLGSNAASTSNLSYYSTYGSLHFAILSFMKDSDIYNIDRLGHRRWILNPNLKKVGFGYAESYEKEPAAYTVLKVFDKSRDKDFDYDYISWPSKNIFPTLVFKKEDAWSISLNPLVYDNKKVEEIRVKLIRLIDNKTWEFGKEDKNLKGKYFNVETNNYAVPFCIIFRPDINRDYQQDDSFKVEVTGIYNINGQKTKIEYTTDFFDIEEYLKPNEELINQEKDIIFVDIKNHWAKDNIEELYNLGIILGYEDNTIRPNENITRAQMAVIVARALGYSEEENAKVKFKDEMNIPLWARAFVNALVNDGIINGYEDGTFRANEVVTRQEMAVIIAKAYSLREKRDRVALSDEKVKEFTDIQQAGEWSRYYIMQLKNLGIVNGYENNSFKPSKSVKRAELFTIILKCQKMEWY